MTVTVRLFARYAEVLMRDVAVLTLPVGATVADALARLREEIPAARDLLPERPFCAVGLDQVGTDAVLGEGEELALLPPVAGG